MCSLSCAGDLPGPGPGPASDDLSSAPDLSSSESDLAGNGCAGLAACACRANTNCQPIAEPCYCPFPECGVGACICGGGAYHGCAPKASACTATVACNPAGRIAADDKGCLSCKYETDCEKSFKQMMDKLKATAGCGISDALVSAFSCQKNPSCVAKCVNEVKTCTDIGCALCAACGCARKGTFETCFFACTQ